MESAVQDLSGHGDVPWWGGFSPLKTVSLATDHFRNSPFFMEDLMDHSEDFAMGKSVI